MLVVIKGLPLPLRKLHDFMLLSSIRNMTTSLCYNLPIDNIIGVNPILKQTFFTTSTQRTVANGAFALQEERYKLNKEDRKSRKLKQKPKGSSFDPKNSLTKLEIEDLVETIKNYNRKGDFFKSLNLFNEFVTELRLKNKLVLDKISIKFINAGFTTLLRLKKYQDLEETFKLLDKWKIEPDIITFNIIFKARLETGRLILAEELYNNMNKMGLRQNEVTLLLFLQLLMLRGRDEQVLCTLNQTKNKTSLLTYDRLIDEACKIRKISLASKVYKLMLKAGYTPTYSSIYALIRGSLKANLPLAAHRIYLEIEKKPVKKDLQLYTMIIEGLLINRQYELSLFYLNIFKNENKVNREYLLKLWDRLMKLTLLNISNTKEKEGLIEIKKYLIKNFEMPSSCFTFDVYNFFIENKDIYFPKNNHYSNGRVVEIFYNKLMTELQYPNGLEAILLICQLLCDNDMLDYAIETPEFAFSKFQEVPTSLYIMLLQACFQRNKQGLVSNLLSKISMPITSPELYSVILNGFLKYNPEVALRFYRSAREGHCPLILSDTIKVIRLCKRLGKTDYIIWAVNDALGKDDNKSSFKPSTTMVEIDIFLHKLELLNLPSINRIIYSYRKQSKKNGDKFSITN